MAFPTYLLSFKSSPKGTLSLSTRQRPWFACLGLPHDVRDLQPLLRSHPEIRIPTGEFLGRLSDITGGLKTCPPQRAHRKFDVRRLILHYQRPQTSAHSVRPCR